MQCPQRKRVELRSPRGGDDTTHTATIPQDAQRHVIPNATSKNRTISEPLGNDSSGFYLSSLDLLLERNGYSIAIGLQVDMLLLSSDGLDCRGGSVGVSWAAELVQ